MLEGLCGSGKQSLQNNSFQGFLTDVDISLLFGQNV